MSVRVSLGRAVLLAGLLLTACGGGGPGGSSLSVSPAEFTPSVRRESMQLVLLHTNDNWGETEPCG